MKARLATTWRALWPRIDRTKLRFRGGWFALPIYLVVISMYPLSLQHADWVETSSQFWWIAIAGVFVGTLLGNGRIRFGRAVLAGATLGMLMITLSTTFASTGGGAYRDKLTHFAILVNNWITQVLAGEAASDPTVFVLFLGASVWCATFVGSFVLARTGRIWDAVIFNGACLVINVSVALTNLYPDLIVFTLAVLVLLVRIHIVNLQERWTRQNIVPSGEMDWRLLRGGLTWTAVLVIMSLVTPRVGAAEVLNGAWSTFEGPYHGVEAEWQRFFAGVSGPSRLRGVSFSDSIRLGQAPNLGDRVVMTVEAGSGHFWRAVTYDFYTGAGWRTTESDKADKITLPTADREIYQARFDIVVPHSNILFAANEPQKVDVPYQFYTGADKTYSTSLHALNRSQAAGSYTVTSLVSTADKQTLRKVAAAYPDYIKAKYLQLPSTLPPRVKALAHSLPEPAVLVLARGQAHAPGERSDRVLPLRSEERLLRVLRVRDGRPAPRGRSAGAARRGIHNGHLRLGEQRLRGQRAGRARVGRGLLPPVRMDRVRADPLAAAVPTRRRGGRQRVRVGRRFRGRRHQL